MCRVKTCTYHELDQTTGPGSLPPNGISGTGNTCLDLNPLTQLSHDDQVQDDGRGQEGVLTGVVQYDGVVPSHTDLGCVLVHRSLAVTHIRNILDHNLMEDQDWLDLCVTKSKGSELKLAKVFP